ncbi:MAG: hypothetical protein MMC33_004347 [Icmadophila ericetorum]|nr:hypothetical protein [Icmadophila ericetorum]
MGLECLEFMHLHDEPPDTDGGVRLPREENPRPDADIERMENPIGSSSVRKGSQAIQSSSNSDVRERQALQNLHRGYAIPHYASLPIDPLGSTTSSKELQSVISSGFSQGSTKIARSWYISHGSRDFYHKASEEKDKTKSHLAKHHQKANRIIDEKQRRSLLEESTDQVAQAKPRLKREQLREKGEEDRQQKEAASKAEHEASVPGLEKRAQLAHANHSSAKTPSTPAQVVKANGSSISTVKETPSTWDSPQSPSSLVRKSPHVANRAREPCPTRAYLQHSSLPLRPTSEAQRLLVVLDLNGTLLTRNPYNKNSLRERPGLRKFLTYLFQNHSVMIWSSATPPSVQNMISNILTAPQQSFLIQSWARNRFKLSKADYFQNVQVYKRLELIWNDKQLQALNSDKSGIWDQSNTVLIDDSTLKAVTQPFNHIEVPEYGWPGGLENGTEVLCQVASYLEDVRKFNDVSRYMRQKRFAIDNSRVWSWREGQVKDP